MSMNSSTNLSIKRGFSSYWLPKWKNMVMVLIGKYIVSSSTIGCSNYFKWHQYEKMNLNFKKKKQYFLIKL